MDQHSSASHDGSSAPSFNFNTPRTNISMNASLDEGAMADFAPSDFLKHLPPSTEIPSGNTDEPSPAQASDLTSATGPSKPQVNAQGRRLNPRSCVTCRKRKVKCDKTHPCANCNRAHIECVFPSPGRAPRKSRKVGEGKDKELLERLRRLEGVVKGLGVDVPDGPAREENGGAKDTDNTQHSGSRKGSGEDSNEHQKGTTIAEEEPPSNTDDHLARTRWIEEQQHGRFENRFGRLVINEGKSRYVNNSFWASLSNEVEDLKGILNQSSDEEDVASPGSNPATGTTHQSWIFGYSSQSMDMLSLHPLPSQIGLYWETYKDRVDPLVKILHIPTLEPKILQAASQLSSLSKGFESLLFAIYYGAVTSLTPQDCFEKFGEERPVLLSRYRFAVEQAMARTNFLTTEEIVVLQAFVIFLICLRRNSDARVIWTLTGLIVRIAQTIGIHRDGSHFGLPPFEIEMRRRLWWQVCILDTRASEDHGCDPTIIEQTFDTLMPLNINDADIWPDIKELPAERAGCTDISFCLIRFEVSNTFRRLNYVPPGPRDYHSVVTLQDKETWITECHQRLEDRYLKHCDMGVPLFWVTATVARLMMSKMWLMVYHPFQRQDGGASLSAETKEKLFITSLENIEYSVLLETESRTMKWGWLFKTYMQWHALAFMLSELCHRRNGELVDRAWVAVDKVCDRRFHEPLDDANGKAGHLWRPLQKLYNKAKEARRQGLHEEAATAKLVAAAHQRPERRYSPNANPMFGHPNRPQVVRAPLSNAQLQRFTQGPSFGSVPLDKHTMLMSPRLSLASEAEVDPMDSTDSSDVNARSQMNGVQPATTGQSMFSTPGSQNEQSGTNAFSFSQFPNQNTASADNPANFFDPQNMNTGDELDWENWDQLVRQFGMDVDMDSTNNTTGPNWDAGTGPNLRMGMGMGGGDWF